MNTPEEQAAREYTDRTDGAMSDRTPAQREHDAFLTGVAWARANPPPSDPLDKLPAVIAGLKP